jgi:hypothetical protein
MKREFKSIRDFVVFRAIASQEYTTVELAS